MVLCNFGGGPGFAGGGGGGHPCRGVICGMWGCGLCPRSKARCERFSPSEVYPAGKVQ